MAVFGNTFFETRVEQLFDLAQLVEKIFAASALEYRVIGGLAVYLYVEEADPDAGRLTRISISPSAAKTWQRSRRRPRPFGLEHRHTGTDMLVQAARPSARRAVEIEGSLSGVLRERLGQARARE